MTKSLMALPVFHGTTWPVRLHVSSSIHGTWYPPWPGWFSAPSPAPWCRSVPAASLSSVLPRLQIKHILIFLYSAAIAASSGEFWRPFLCLALRWTFLFQSSCKRILMAVCCSALFYILQLELELHTYFSTTIADPVEARRPPALKPLIWCIVLFTVIEK